MENENIARAEYFRRLHEGFLVLPNAWDAASARVIVVAGFEAVATTSGGVSAALGYQDGEQTPREQMLDAVRRIARAVEAPVTADIERGYADSSEELFETVRAVAADGVVGINLEDGTGNPASPLREIPEQVERLQAAREAAKWAGIPLFINARVDVFLHSKGDGEANLREAIRRAQAYLAAGANSIFPIMLQDKETIRTLVQEIPAPLNVFVRPGVPSLPELQELGVKRVSFGSALLRAMLRSLRHTVEDLRDQRRYEGLFEGG